MELTDNQLDRLFRQYQTVTINEIAYYLRLNRSTILRRVHQARIGPIMPYVYRFTREQVRRITQL